MGIVVVPKVGDTPQFRTSLIRSANEIAQSAVAARVLLERDADAPAVLILAGECDEIVFLCHGLSSAGPSQGPGICVSASGYLPPNPLPVEADNDLSAFALSWSDFLGLPRGPRVIVSMACSTGRTVIGPGGSRIGLEQCFLTRGGTAIISPLWNVDQEPSLAWLGSFYDAHTSGASGDVGIAHRLACLETLQRYSHPFAWGSFLLTRRLPRRPT